MRASALDGFSVDLIKQIRSEDPGVWTAEFGDEVVDLTTEAVELENIYTQEPCPDEILGTRVETDRLDA